MENRIMGAAFGRLPSGAEIRTIPATGLQVEEFRAEAGTGLRLVGYAARYGVLSADLGGWREVLQRGAFRPVLEEQRDVYFGISHGRGGLGLPLARVSNRTLAVAEDAHGLRFGADIADTQEGRDLVTLVRRRDVRAMSFAFRLDRDRAGLDRWDETEHGLVRTVIAVSDLFEISAVAEPAYPLTTIGAAA